MCSEVGQGGSLGWELLTLGTHTRSLLEQHFLYLSILQEQAACSTFLERSPRSLLGWWLRCHQERQPEWLLSNCEQGSRLLTRRRFVPSSQRDHPKKPSPWSIPSPSQQLTLDAHTHLNGLSWNHNSHKAVETAGYRGLWAKWPKFKSWFCLLQAMPKTLYFSVPQFPLICMMEESQGLIGQLNSCLTVLSTRRRDDTIPQSQTNLKWAHFLE